MQEGHEALPETTVHPHLPNSNSLGFSRDTRSWPWMSPAQESSCAWMVHGTTGHCWPWWGISAWWGDVQSTFWIREVFYKAQYRVEEMVGVWRCGCCWDWRLLEIKSIVAAITHPQSCSSLPSCNLDLWNLGYSSEVSLWTYNEGSDLAFSQS